MSNAITKRMDIIGSDIQNLFKNLDCKENFLQLLKIAKKSNADRVPFILRKLAQKINDNGVLCEYGRSISYYEKLISTLELPESVDEVNQKIVNTLGKIYSEYPRPEEFMERIVADLDSDATCTDSLRLRILRRFLSTVNVKQNKKYYSKTLAKKEIADIEENIFQRLEDESIKKCDSIPLLQAAHHLAKGSFISPAKTKEWLFLLAFAYDMKYYSSINSDDYDAQRDVEKNLFTDYYCDNLTRYIYSEDGGNSGNSDKEPSGLGLNPKNFVDVIFIYYLNAEGLETSKKVAGFYTMIDKVKDAWKCHFEYVETRKSEYEATPTALYRNKIDTIINEMDEDSLQKYLLDHYFCDVRYSYANQKTGEIQEGSKGPFELQFSINSAYKQYCEILDLIKDGLNLSKDVDFSKIDRRAIHDIVVVRTRDLEQNVPFSEAESFKSFVADGERSEELWLIIKNIEKRLNPYEVIGITNAMNVTRTKLIAAYYHYYCLENGLDDGSNTWSNFKDVYDDMSLCLNDYLKEAGYQPINSKNLYDVFVIFFAYCKINNFLT